MLQQLLECKNLQDFTELGVKLCDNSNYKTLLSDIKDEGLVFNLDFYWMPDRLSKYVADDNALQHAVVKTEKEKYNVRVLHMLQLWQMCCPAVNSKLEKLLKKTSC